MVLKALLFGVIALLCGALLWIERADVITGALILALMWSSARLYYFVFYVIERYIDADYKFAGIGSLLSYLWRVKRAKG